MDFRFYFEFELSLSQQSSKSIICSKLWTWLSTYLSRQVKGYDSQFYVNNFGVKLKHTQSCTSHSNHANVERHEATHFNTV